MSPIDVRMELVKLVYRGDLPAIETTERAKVLERYVLGEPEQFLPVAEKQGTLHMPKRATGQNSVR